MAAQSIKLAPRPPSVGQVIYSLDVLLHELLTGSIPFDTQELVQSGLDEMRRIICERTPLKPSTRSSQVVSQSGPSSRPVTNQASLASDLDWIILKCLEKDRTRRYETANGLSMDIERHLHNEPIAARPPGTAYRLCKAWRRNQSLAGNGRATGPSGG